MYVCYEREQSNSSTYFFMALLQVVLTGRRTKASLVSKSEITWVQVQWVGRFATEGHR